MRQQQQEQQQQQRLLRSPPHLPLLLAPGQTDAAAGLLGQEGVLVRGNGGLKRDLLGDRVSAQKPNNKVFVDTFFSLLSIPLRRPPETEHPRGLPNGSQPVATDPFSVVPICDFRTGDADDSLMVQGIR